ncbi:MAG: tRNA dihydrouridine synthase DusB [Bacteroidales bacterium]
MKIGSIDLGLQPLLLAPLEDITDSPFRQLCKGYGADMVFTEFISSEGLTRKAAKSFNKLDFDETERPVAIQIFGHDPEAMRQAAILAAKAEPDSIDINFGCPVKKVISKGGGADLLRDIPRMISITKAVTNAVNLPVTVKTRLGWDEQSKNIVEIAEKLQDCGIAAIIIHGRTRAQLYKGIADWTLIGKVKNNPAMKIPVIGNGDIDSPQKAKQMFDDFGVDGIMIGRAAIGNPWIFKQIKTFLTSGEIPDVPDINERISVCRTHLIISVALKGERRAILEMRRHYSGYFRTLPRFKAHRIKLLTLNSLDEILSLFDQISQENQI